MGFLHKFIKKIRFIILIVHIFNFNELDFIVSVEYSLQIVTINHFKEWLFIVMLYINL